MKPQGLARAAMAGEMETTRTQLNRVPDQEALSANAGSPRAV